MAMVAVEMQHTVTVATLFFLNHFSGVLYIKLMLVHTKSCILCTFYSA